MWSPQQSPRHPPTPRGAHWSLDPGRGATKKAFEIKRHLILGGYSFELQEWKHEASSFEKVLIKPSCPKVLNATANDWSVSMSLFEILTNSLKLFFLQSQFSAAAVLWVMTTGVGSQWPHISAVTRPGAVGGSPGSPGSLAIRSSSGDQGRQDVNHQSWPGAQSQLTRVWEPAQVHAGPGRPATVAQETRQLTQPINN